MFKPKILIKKGSLAKIKWLNGKISDETFIVKNDFEKHEKYVDLNNGFGYPVIDINYNKECILLSEV